MTTKSTRYILDKSRFGMLLDKFAITQHYKPNQRINCLYMGLKMYIIIKS